MSVKVVELLPDEAFNVLNQDAVDRGALSAGFFAVDSTLEPLPGCVRFSESRLQMEFNQSYQVWEYSVNPEDETIKEDVCPEKWDTGVLFHDGSQSGLDAMAQHQLKNLKGDPCTVFAIKKDEFLARFPFIAEGGKINDLQWKMPTIVDDNVFWSGRSVVEVPACLHRLGITAAVDLSTSSQNWASLDHYLAVGIDDYASELWRFLQELPRIMAFIEEQVGLARRVLVHCDAGRSRSASVILAYVMHKRNLTCNEALADLMQRRPVVREVKEGSLIQAYIAHLCEI